MNVEQMRPPLAQKILTSLWLFLLPCLLGAERSREMLRSHTQSQASLPRRPLHISVHTHGRASKAPQTSETRDMLHIFISRNPC